MNKLQLTKHLNDLRQKVKGKLFSEVPELYKDIESTKAIIRKMKEGKE